MSKKSQPVPPGPLGWISPADRTKAQTKAHEKALAGRPKFALAPPETAGPVKVMLTDFWSKPEVVADMGRAFIGFHQLTGSCVGVSEGNAIATLSAVQRMIADAPTKAFIPFWPFPYGRTRYNEGDRGQGEGAVDSVMGDTLGREGVFAWDQPGLPTPDWSDGIAITSREELQWSDGAAIEKKWRDLAGQNLLGAHATLNSTADIKAAILNGFPVLDGCEMYIGNGSIRGSGDTAYVGGQYDGRGGHSTCYLGYWDHPNDGPLYLYSNQWPTSTYPKDPAGGGRCTVWVKESVVAKLFSQYGGDNGETMACSHLSWFPAQPKVFDFADFL